MCPPAGSLPEMCTHMGAWTRRHITDMYVHTHTHISTGICTCTFVCTLILAQAHTWVYSHSRRDMHTDVRTHIRDTCTHMCTQIQNIHTCATCTPAQVSFMCTQSGYHVMELEKGGEDIPWTLGAETILCTASPHALDTGGRDHTAHGVSHALDAGGRVCTAHGVS